MTAIVGFVVTLSFGGFDSLIRLDSSKEVISIDEPEDIFADEVENGIHIPTGFIAKGDYGLVIQNCLACHSSKLITENRMDVKGWTQTIEWMQETQNLWPLGENKEKIAIYLGEYYKPEKVGRRKPLIIDEWYTIE
ncbi:MAG: monoheme cytochrome C [Salibacteraceae bacterium]